MENKLKKEINYINIADELLEWLISSDIRTQEGGLFAWIGSEGPSFIYTEVTAYFVKLCLYAESLYKNACIYDKIGNSINYLIKELTDNDGKIIHRGNAYVFDTAMVLSALMAINSKYGIIPDLPVKKGIQFIINCLNNRKGIERFHGILQDRWSTRYSPHLLKVLPILCDYSSLYSTGISNEINELIPKVVEDFIISKSVDPSFFSDYPVYTHSFCYAMEGLLGMKSRGEKNLDEIIKKGIQILSEWQNDDGSFYNWQGRGENAVIRLTDATAQAIRLFIAGDSQKYNNNIEKGLEYLATKKSPEGGLFYDENNVHRNACATIFSVQAFLWGKYTPGIKDMV